VRCRLHNRGIAETVEFLASEWASYITIQILLAEPEPGGQ
jgi:hypothetical protein